MRTWTSAELSLALGVPAAAGPGRDRSSMGVSTDSRTMEPGCAFVCLAGENFDAHDYIPDVIARGASAVIASRSREPGLRAVAESSTAAVFFVEDTLAALSNLARFARSRLRCPVLGVAGSNGKTSTKDMALAIGTGVSAGVYGTRGNLNNHIGLPLTLANIPDDARLVILEMGMNHSGELAALSQIARPNHSIVTSIAQEHAEFFASLDAIAEAELEIAAGMPEGGSLLFHARSPCQGIALRAAARAGLLLHVYEAEGVEISGAGVSFSFRGRRIQNPHYFSAVMAENLYGAILLLSCAGLSEAEIAAAASKARPQAARRFQVFRRRGSTGEILLVDDSYNANQASFEAAIRSLRQILPKGRLALFAGEMAELGDVSPGAHRGVGEAAGECRFDAVFSSGGTDAGILLDGYRARFKEGRAILRPSGAGLPEDFNAEDYDGILVKGSRRARMDLVSDEIKKTGFTG